MFRALLMVFCLAAGLSGGVVPAASQAGAPAQEQATDVTSADEPVLAQATPSGLPERPQFPRTLRDYWHVFIAFSVVWVLLFGYALTLGRRFGKLEEELRRLRKV